jgi:acetyltransferase-like isoleucine patch superfamily enzyme
MKPYIQLFLFLFPVARVRRAIYKRLIKSMGERVSIFPYVYIYSGKNLEIGDKAVINVGTVIIDDTQITIGSGTMIGCNVVISTVNHNYEGGRLVDLGITNSPIIIGDDVWIAPNVTILPGVTIGDGAIIGAGSVVADDVPPNTVVAGVPARKIKDRVV